MADRAQARKSRDSADSAGRGRGRKSSLGTGSTGKRNTQGPDEFRKHPYHNPNWGTYPNINIKQGRKGAGRKRKTYDDMSDASIRTLLQRLVHGPESEAKYYRIKAISLPLLLKFIAKFSVWLEIMMYLVIITSIILTSFSAFYSFFDQDLWSWIAVMDMLFAADTVLRLSVEIWRYHARANVVVFTAPYTMIQFICDALSMIPLHQLYYWFVGSDELGDLSMIDYFRLNRLIRLTRCVTFFGVMEKRRMADEKLLFLFKFTNYYLGFVYLTGCILVSCIGVDPLDYVLFNKLQKLDVSFLHNFQKRKKGYGSAPWDIFVITTNFATAVITTVGYGDVTPNNELEMSICIVCMLVGAIFLNGYYTSEMTNFEVELDGARFDLFYRLGEIRNFLASIKSLPFFNKKCEEYYNCLWTYREGVFDVPFMKAFPESFHEELLFDICQELFDKSYLFKNLDPAFLRAVSKIVTVALYNPNMILCQTGAHALQLYYILQGECQAMSKLNPANPGAIIRAGSIIGEANLLFSYPYTTTVETRTCCQFVMLRKIDLLEIVDKFPAELEILRSRSMVKTQELYETHQAYGVDPVCWVKTKSDIDNPGSRASDKFRKHMRWSRGLNKEVLEDVVDDSERTVIFHTPCSDPTVEKNHLIPYMSCAIPEILNNDLALFSVWNFFIMGISLWYAFAGPYCLVFAESTKLEHYMCRTQSYLARVISIIYVIDVFVEILGACPVAGWYYKFWDGLNVTSKQGTFYLDVLAAVPFDVFTAEDQNIMQIMGTVMKVFKMWKVIRYLHYLDNVYPLQLFWFRLAQTITILLYGIHFLACISYHVACPYVKEKKAVVCHAQSWLASYEIFFTNDYGAAGSSEKIPTQLRRNTLGYDYPYLYAFYYSAATLTSAGFGDFNPQNRSEMLWAIGFQLFGFFLCGYYTSVLTSALSCLVRPRLALQQQLVSLTQFMNVYHIREHIKDRIMEYFVLQHQLKGGVSLERGAHLMYDAPTYLRDDVFYLEVCDLLDGVPVFSKVRSDLIIQLSSAMKRFVIPPHTTFVLKGEVRRILYIIKQGSMGVFEDGTDKPVSILQSTTHFGIRDLLFGEPSHYAIRSLSYVTMYAVRRKEFEEVLQEEEELWELVNKEKDRIEEVIHEMTMIYSSMEKTSSHLDKATKIPSWVEIPRRVPLKKESGRQDKILVHINMLNDEYEEAFKSHRLFRFIKWFLLRKTIHPVGYFSKFWNCIMSLISCLTVITLMLETFCYIRSPPFRLFQYTLDWFNYIDIYLKLHWSYYNPHNGMLITHPLKTAMNYILNGSLASDVAICAPMELCMWIFQLTDVLGYGPGATWYSRLRWFRFFQLRRIPMVFKIVQNVFKHRSLILVSLYVTVTIFVCTAVSAIAQFIACPWESNHWTEGDEYKLPICQKNSWVYQKYDTCHTDPEVISDVIRRCILGLYYVSQVILVIGFGDMITLQKADIALLIFMCLFGFIFMRCIVGDMTAAEVDSDQARATFVETMTVLDLVMKREKVPKKLAISVMSHLRYTWTRSRGLQPRQLFGDLHPVLESELYKHLIGDKLQKIPVFNSFPPTVLRSICRYMKKQYILRGERIMRYGNLEFGMCIIDAGKVFITDQFLNYICSLGPGESFGESSLIYGMGRRHNAIAATNVEIYTLSASRFETFLSRYPNFRDDMRANLQSGMRDYFETLLDDKMHRAEMLSPDRKNKMLDTFAHRSDIVKDLVAHKEDLELSGLDLAEEKLKKRNFLFGYGDLDDHLPLIYLCAVMTKRKKFSCHFVIHPNSLLIKYFLTIITWLCFLTPAIAAYEVCFSKEFLSSEKLGVQSDSFILSKKLHQISQIIEFTFLGYIALQFFLAYQVKPGVYNKTLTRIILRYITAADGLIYDLIGSFPFILEMLMEFFQVDFTSLDPFIQTILQNLYLLRSVRLYQYFKSQMRKREDLDVSTFRLQITLSVTSFVLMAHMLACLFYWISPCRRPDITNTTFKFENLCPPIRVEHEDNTWTYQYTIDKDIQTDKERLEAWRWWFRSLYWVVTTISTTGFGDVVPVTINEMVVGIICIFCGAFILSIILSQFTSGMASLTRTHREYMYQVLLLVKHLKNIGLSEIRQSQVMMYFLTMWERCRGMPYHKTISKLPISLQIEVAYALFGKTLLKVPYFDLGTEDRIFMRQLCNRVIHSLYIPGTYIHKDGDPGSNLFVVYKGQVSGTLVMANGEPELKAIYNPGDSFGRFPAFFHKGTYKKAYRAESMVELLEVKQKDIVHLAKKFPQFRKILFSFVMTRYDPAGYNRSIFNKQRRRAQYFGVADQLDMGRATRKARRNRFKFLADVGDEKKKSGTRDDSDRRKYSKNKRRSFGSNNSGNPPYNNGEDDYKYHTIVTGPYHDKGRRDSSGYENDGRERRDSMNSGRGEENERRNSQGRRSSSGDGNRRGSRRDSAGSGRNRRNSTGDDDQWERRNSQGRRGSNKRRSSGGDSGQRRNSNNRNSQQYSRRQSWGNDDQGNSRRRSSGNDSRRDSNRSGNRDWIKYWKP